MTYYKEVKGHRIQITWVSMKSFFLIAGHTSFNNPALPLLVRGVYENSRISWNSFFIYVVWCLAFCVYYQYVSRHA